MREAQRFLLGRCRSHHPPPDAHAYSDVHNHADSYAYIDTHGHADSYAYVDTHGHADGYTYAYIDTYDRADSYTCQGFPAPGVEELRHTPSNRDFSICQHRNDNANQYKNANAD